MRITILTPTRNAATYLRECLESVRAQGWDRDRLQHLVLDSCSTDGTPELARAAGAEVSSEPDTSLYQALNRGIRLARGEVIGWLNADDALAPGALDAVGRAFERSPGLDLVVGDCAYAHPWGHEVRKGSALALRRIRQGSTSPQWVVPLAAWFRTETLRRLGPYDETLRIAADLDLWFRAAGATPPLRVAHAGAVLGTFRVHEGSLSTGATLARTREETLAVCARWMGDPSIPRGIRRHAAYVHRRDQLFQIVETAGAPEDPLRRSLWLFGQVGRLRPRGLASAWDARVQLAGALRHGMLHGFRRILPESRRDRQGP